MPLTWPAAASSNLFCSDCSAGKSSVQLFTPKQKRMVLVIAAGVALACALTYISSLIWPPPNPFWLSPN